MNHAIRGLACALALLSAPLLAAPRVEVLHEGLEHPWALAFLPNEQGLLISERGGRLRLFDAQGRLSEPLDGVPAVFAVGQGGLLDVVLSPGFDEDRLVYLSFAQAEDDKAATSVGRGRLSEDLRRLEDFEVIFRQAPALSTGHHFGSRLVFDRDGYLFIALGEHNQRPTAQHLDKLQGKVVRLHPDGRVPADNPFVGREDARPEIWSYGHRNQQGAALNPWSGRLWTHEHGPRGGDEINIPEAGKNYGWPVITYGENYGGGAIGDGLTAKPGMEQPLHHWTPSIAPSGMAFLGSDRYGSAWQGNLFVGSLKFRYLARLELQGGRVVREERLLPQLGQRVRDVRQGPDGLLYLLTDENDGQLLRVVPQR